MDQMSHSDFEAELTKLREQANRLQSELFELRQHIGHLQRRAAREHTPAASPPPAAHPLAAPSDREVLCSDPPAPLPEAAAPFGDQPTAHDAGAFELVIGARWLNRVGAVIVLLAVAFFVKYSFDQGWLSPAVRCLLGGALGFVLIASGEYSLFRKLQHFAVGLLGAGMASLYLSVFAAQSFYALLSTEAAFALYCLITALSTVIAVHGRMQAIAVLAVLGGLLTPVALSTGRDAQVALMTYLLLLDVAFLVAASIRRWDVIRLLCWVGTALLFAGWFSRFYQSEAFLRTFGFLLAFYLLS